MFDTELFTAWDSCSHIRVPALSPAPAPLLIQLPAHAHSGRQRTMAQAPESLARTLEPWPELWVPGLSLALAWPSPGCSGHFRGTSRWKIDLCLSKQLKLNLVKLKNYERIGISCRIKFHLFISTLEIGLLLYLHVGLLLNILLFFFKHHRPIEKFKSTSKNHLPKFSGLCLHTSLITACKFAAIWSLDMSNWKERTHKMKD